MPTVWRKNQRALATTPPRLELRLHARQGKALLTRACEILYGGAAGGGKSHLLRAAAVFFCLEIPGLQVYLFRRLFVDLQKNHLEGPNGFLRLMAPFVSAGFCAIVKGQIRFWNGSRIHLCHVQHDKDKFKYQGAEIHLALFDELTHFTEDIYTYLRGRCRVVGLPIPDKYKGMFPRIISGSNPGGIGHGWVKRTFVAHGPELVHQAPRDEGGMPRIFIPAKLDDNPSLLRDDPTYLERLEGLGDKALVRAMRDGDWNIVAGAMFGEVWREALHECDPFPIPYGWEIWRAADDGYSAPASCHWLTRDPKTDTYYVIAELYRTKMTAEQFGEAVLEIDGRIQRINYLGEREENTEHIQGLLDDEAFASEDDRESRASIMNRMGCDWEPVGKYPGQRVHRAQELHRKLAPNPKDPRGGPGVRFFRNCVNAIETIPTLSRDPHNPEDVNTKENDHAYDSCTYGFTWRTERVSRVRVRGR